MTAKLLAVAVTLVLAMASPGAAAGPAAPRDDRPVVSLAKSRAGVDAGGRAPTMASRKLDRADDDDEDDDRDDEDEGDGDGDDDEGDDGDGDDRDGDDGDGQTPPPDVPPVVTPPVVVPPVVAPPGDGKPPTETPPRPPSDPPVETPPPPTEPPRPPTQIPPRPPGGAQLVGGRSCNALNSRRTAGTRSSPRQRCLDARKKKKPSPARRRR